MTVDAEDEEVSKTPACGHLFVMETAHFPVSSCSSLDSSFHSSSYQWWLCKEQSTVLENILKCMAWENVLAAFTTLMVLALVVYYFCARLFKNNACVRITRSSYNADSLDRTPQAHHNLQVVLGIIAEVNYGGGSVQMSVRRNMAASVSFLPSPRCKIYGCGCRLDWWVDELTWLPRSAWISSFTD